jgi:hypothetical protein
VEFDGVTTEYTTEKNIWAQVIRYGNGENYLMRSFIILFLYLIFSA